MSRLKLEPENVTYCWDFHLYQFLLKQKHKDLFGEGAYLLNRNRRFRTTPRMSLKSHLIVYN